MKEVKRFLGFVVFLLIISLNANIAKARTQDVTTFAEFKAALLDATVTRINVNRSIRFEGHIINVPNRDVMIYGNADKNIIIDSYAYHIYGKQNRDNPYNTLSIINADIIARGTPNKDNYTDGFFFIGGYGSSYDAFGWNVYAKDVKFTGGMFVRVSNGTLTFDGNNEIYTNAENAYVEHVVFKSGSTYRSSNSYVGGYPTFNFNHYSTKYEGTATLEEGAKTYFNNSNYYYPVFYGDFYNLTVKNGALFDVNALGYALYFLPASSSTYTMGNPQINVESGGIVNIKQIEYSRILNTPKRTNCNPNYYTPIYFYGTTIDAKSHLPGIINVNDGAYFYVSGFTNANSKVGIIRGGQGFTINLTRPADFDIKNYAVNSQAIAANCSNQRMYINILSDVYAWNKTSTYWYYDDLKPTRVYTDVKGTSTIKYNTSENNFTNNDRFNSEFKTEQFGRIAAKGGEEQKFTVLFDADGGTPTPAVQNVVKDGKIVEPANPTKPGFKFVGWYIQNPKDLNTKWDFVKGTVVSDVNLIAKWEALPITLFKVTFDVNGGAPAPAEQDVEQGKLVSEPTKPSKTGYEFKGWFTDDTFVTEWNFATDTIGRNINLIAKWDKHEEDFVINFNADGGTPAPAPQKVSKDGTITMPPAMTKPGYTFAGWYSDSMLTTKWDFSNKVTSDLNLYAKWINDNPSKYTIVFDTDGGSPQPKEQQITEGLEIKEPAMPTKMGYDFDGWYTSKNYTTKWDFGRGVTSNMILYAKWKPSTREEFIVKFDSRGGDKTPKTQIVKKGEFASAPAKPSLAGYDFVGWFKDPNGAYKWTFKTDAVYSDITLYAVWTKPTEKFTVTFDSKGGSSVSPITDVASGSLIAMPNTPTKAGDCFSGWFTDKTFNTRWIFTKDKVYSNITLYAKWCYNN